MNYPLLRENTWHLISSDTACNMKELLKKIYPNSLITYDQIWSVNNGWDTQYPYTGQTSNQNWDSHSHSSPLNPYLGYWTKINSIYTFEELTNPTRVNNVDNYVTFNSASEHIPNMKYGITLGQYSFQSIPESIAFRIDSNSFTMDGQSLYKYNENSYYFGDVTVTVTEPFDDFVSVIYNNGNSEDPIFVYCPTSSYESSGSTDDSTAAGESSGSTDDSTAAGESSGSTDDSGYT